ncbi:MAG: pyrroline-5-carboxylate reductase [Phycisphaerales bacterium]
MLIAVKPQMFEAVGAELAPVLSSTGQSERGEPLVVSIMAGTRAAAIRERLGGAVRVVRAMPNTPARIGQGVTGIAAGPGATEADLAVAERLFRACGPVVVRIDEGLMDAFTAVAGSGPAYLFYLAEAMERAAVAVGFDGATARGMVGQTIRGAAALLEQGADPAALRAAVTSKGGTTAAATGSLDRDGVAEAVGRAIAAGRDRGRELAGGG